MAESERDNISFQTMAGRREKARQDGWNGVKPPYGYILVDGKITILEEEAEHIRIILLWSTLTVPLILKKLNMNWI